MFFAPLEQIVLADAPLAVAAQWATVVTGIGIAIGLAQFGFQIRTTEKENQRTERAREEQAFLTMADDYRDWLVRGLERPGDPFSDLTTRRLQELGEGEQSEQFLLSAELFFQMLEKAFILYRAEHLYDDQGVLAPVNQSRPEQHTFRERQWLGWHDWLVEYLKIPAVRNAWFALGDDSTFDTKFCLLVAREAGLAGRNQDRDRHREQGSPAAPSPTPLP